ncbi:MFS transporter [Rhodobacterales bacterium HKCCE3408]|nr:MFS transporter [Rhodobacterales bacterium HKCCE3408]
MTDLRTPWRAVAAAFALNGTLLGVWAARIPAVMERHDLDEGEFGLMLLAMGLGALISFPIAGKVADSRGAVGVTRFLAVTAPLTVLVVGLAPSPWILAPALFAFGMTYGAMDVTMNSWATEVERAMGRSVMSSFHAMWSFGAGFGAATGYVAAKAGLPVPLHFLLAILLAGLLLGPFLTQPWTSDRRASTGSEPFLAIPRGALILVGVIALASGLGEGAMADWSAVFLRDVAGTGEARATLGYTIYSVTMVAMRLVVDRLVTRFGPRLVARASGLSAALGLALVTGIATYPAALVGFVLMGCGYAALIPLAFSRAGADPVLPPGQGIAAVATFGYGAILLGPPVIGFIADISSLRVAFVLLGVFALAVAALAPVLEPAARRQTAAA